MCGIFALLNSQNKNYSLEMIYNEFIKGQSRGPEFSKLDTQYSNMILGFHRLAINGLNEASNQPLVIDNIVLICNGEIYNYQEIYKQMGVTPTTGSDCEAIIHLYLRYGIEQTLNMLDGVYSFVLYDISNKNLYVARDPLGVRPLYQIIDNVNYTNKLFGFASELKCLSEIYNSNEDEYIIEQFKPGTYSVFHLTNTSNMNMDTSSSVNDNENEMSLSCWVSVSKNTPYYIPSFSHSFLTNSLITPSSAFDDIFLKISTYLNNAVTKRCLTTERPIACLLSGGLDSSLIAALVNNFYNMNNKPNKLETYSIGLEGSEDLKYAKIVAEYLGTNHTEIIVTEKEIFDAIPEVIRAIESYDTTTVRASIGNYLLGKYIRSHSEAKVIFNGDGSDELLGGYLYMNKCPDDIEFDKEIRRLLKDIYLFDVLRSDKSISSHGLEPRTPFLDKSFVNYILSIPPSIRNHKNGEHCEKYILRQSFSLNYFKDFYLRQILPDIILWRKKEAFSDGVSSHGRSLFQILQEFISTHLNRTENTTKYEANIDTEKQFYRSIFENAYPNCLHILPYFWMPKYTNATDPSARTLDIYNDDGNKEAE
jgi:asparagine synthase (glutamine-hydrolysing)